MPLNVIIHLDGLLAFRAHEVIDELYAGLNGSELEGRVSVECERVEVVETVSNLLKEYPREKLKWRQGRPTP